MGFGKNIIPVIGLICLSGVAAFAQGAPKQKEGPEKSETTGTVDAWRQALPQGENSATVLEENAADTAEESFAVVEKKLVELEYAWMEAIKLRDPSTLKRLLAPDFTQASALRADSPVSKKQYVASAMSDWALRSYDFERLSVRVYLNTVIVDGSYRQQASLGDEHWNGNFIFTDVWVRQNGNWKAVSRHLSKIPR